MGQLLVNPCGDNYSGNNNYLTPPPSLDLGENYTLWKGRLCELKAHVRGFIFDEDGNLLIARRNYESSLPGAFILPGGKIEAGETPVVALYREIREETGLEISRIIEFVGTNTVQRGGALNVGFFFSCEVVKVLDMENRAPKENDSLGFIPFNKLLELPGLLLDRRIICNFLQKSHLEKNNLFC